ncbi:hypothetical protein VFPFJ_11212 [Purpureocillium lilacinum]|uniref:Uncharacterized protein n=1 Tax=Purpureocillium lilacinum TaxID=33203 RepID=A0A179FJZ4_PURLI|nr:hypothetical protein VFPFJ_11212 [Purpureocillium lilacinum]OAQ65677.1 hypothetical protein VFPFJ_11212 [Purpureocillium lilacinum]GJN72436.1 hypothetical protein PLICBS_006509 [Purpureocillium lilacinum]
MASWARIRHLSFAVASLLSLFSVIWLQLAYNDKYGYIFTDLGRGRPGQGPGKAHVHLLVPGNQANSRICRTLMSAIINDYPPPVVINWGQNEGDGSMNGYDMTTGKNWGVLKYLRALPTAAEKDLVIIVDAHDVIFQLPLDITLQRYQSVNERASARLDSQHGLEDVTRHNLRQTVIMGAEKYCWPLDHRHPACWAVPGSTLRPDAYGNATDKATETNRPRWLNSGTVMGPVADLLALYEWAHLLWKAYDTWGGDQDYFSNIYGRQELSRQKLRGSREWVFGFGETFKDDELTWPHLETQHTDYHLGVDLASTVFQDLNSALDDLSSVTHSNLTEVEMNDRQHGTADIYQTPFPFPEDLLRAPLPTEVRRDRANKTVANWMDMPLFSNFHARSIPAILHFNGDKTKIDDWWARQWWTGQGRELLRARMSDPGFAIKTDGITNNTAPWDEMCGAFDRELFIDDPSS